MGLGLAVMEAMKKQHPKVYAAMIRQIKEADKTEQKKRKAAGIEEKKKED